MVSLLANVDTRLATAVAGELGIADLAPLPRVLETPNVPEVAKSPRLSLTARPGELGARGRRVAILVASGAQGVTEVHTALAAGGAVPRYLGSTLGTLKDADGGTLEVDVTMRATPSVLYDAVVLPDGRSAIDQLIANDDAIDFVREQHRHCKPIFAPGAAGAFLEAAGLSERLPSGEADAALLRPRTADAAAIAAFVERVGAHRDFGREPKS